MGGRRAPAAYRLAGPLSYPPQEPGYTCSFCPCKYLFLLLSPFLSLRMHVCMYIMYPFLPISCICRYPRSIVHITCSWKPRYKNNVHSHNSAHRDAIYCNISQNLVRVTRGCACAPEPTRTQTNLAYTKTNSICLSRSPRLTNFSWPV